MNSSGNLTTLEAMGESHGSEEFDLWLEENREVIYSPEHSLNILNRGRHAGLCSPSGSFYLSRLEFLRFHRGTGKHIGYFGNRYGRERKYRS